jgi:hypothetical protein
MSDRLVRDAARHGTATTVDRGADSAATGLVRDTQLVIHVTPIGPCADLKRGFVHSEAGTSSQQIGVCD